MRVLVDKNDVLSLYKIRSGGNFVLKNYSKWFPVKASSDLAGIVADLMGDGSLQAPKLWRFDFASKSPRELWER